jgi:hypothetical protein
MVVYTYTPLSMVLARISPQYVLTLLTGFSRRSGLMVAIILASTSEILWTSTDHLIFLCIKNGNKC